MSQDGTVEKDGVVKVKALPSAESAAVVGDSCRKGSSDDSAKKISGVASLRAGSGTSKGPEVAGRGVEPSVLVCAPLRDVPEEKKLVAVTNDDSPTAYVAHGGSSVDGSGSGSGSNSRENGTITESGTQDTERTSDQISDGGSQNGGDGDTGALPQAYAVDEGEIPLVLGTSVKDGEDTKKRGERRIRFCIILIALLALSLFIILTSIGLTRGFKRTESSTQIEPGPSPSPTPQPLTHCPPEDPALIYSLPSKETDTYCSDDIINVTNTTANSTFGGVGNRTKALCWTRIGPLLDGDRDAKFGLRASLDRSGTRFSVSASKEGSCDGNKLGAIRVYDIRNNLAFVPLGQKIEGLPGDETVAVLSGDGRRLVACFPKRDDLDKRIGGFQVYELNATSGNWALLGDPVIGTPGDMPLEESYFGYIAATDYSGKVIAVGAPRSRNSIGSVFCFRLSNEGLWEQMGEEVLAPDAIQGDRFGYAVSLSSDGATLAVGQQSDHDGEGRVVVYRFKDGSWKELGQQIKGEAIDDKFGKHVSLSADGTTLVAGAKDHTNIDGTGLVRAFRFNNTTSTWARLGGTIKSKALEFKPSRFSITADGNRIAIATGKATTDQGYAEVYDFDGNDWLRVGGKIPANDQTDEYGGVIEISGDGSRLLLSYATENEGVVRIYRLEERRG